MNEKRFEVLFYGDVINCVRDENGKEYNLHELIKLLMEQQATISYLEEANPRLQEQLGETLALVDEQQATISALKEENEQLKQRIKELEE